MDSFYADENSLDIEQTSDRLGVSHMTVGRMIHRSGIGGLPSRCPLRVEDIRVQAGADSDPRGRRRKTST